MDRCKENSTQENYGEKKHGKSLRLPPIKFSRTRDEEWVIRSLKPDPKRYLLPCNVPELVQERRKQRHEKVLEIMRETMENVTAETEKTILLRSQKLNSYLADSCNEVECAISNLRAQSVDESSYATINRTIFTELTERIYKINDERQNEVNKHYKFLVSTEKKRTEDFKFTLRHVYNKIRLISYLLPSEIEDFFENEIARLNEITLNNYHCYSEVKKELILKIQNDARSWTKDLEIIKSDFKEYFIRKAMENISCLKIVHIEEKDDNKRLTSTDYDELISPENLLKEKPTMMNESEIETWWRNTRELFEFLDFRARELISLYKDAIVGVFNRVFDAMRTVTEYLVNSGLADQTDIDYIRREFYKPAIKDLTREYSTDVKDLQSQWSVFIDRMGHKIHQTYVFLREAAALWMIHDSRMAESKRLVSKQMGETIFKTYMESSIIYRKIFKAVDEVRISPQVDDLLNSVKATIDITLAKIKNAYNAATETQTKVVQKLRDLSDVELLVAEIKCFLDTYAEQRGDQRNVEDVVSNTSPLFYNEIQSCEMQIQAVENWMFGLWSSIHTYLQSCKDEKDIELESWIHSRINLIDKRSSTKNTFLKNKFNRLQSFLYNIRLAEITYHSSRMERHRIGIEDELVLAEEELETYRNKIDMVLSEYSKFLENSTEELKKDSNGTRNIHQQLKDIIDSSQEYTLKPSQILEEYKNLWKKKRNRLKKSNLLFLQSIKLFSEDGCYRAAECQTYSKEIVALQKMVNKKFAGLLKIITAAESKMNNKLSSKKKEYLHVIDKFKEECEYTDRAVSKINVLQTKLVNEANNAKNLRIMLKAYMDEFKNIATRNIKNFESLDKNVKNFEDIVHMMKEATNYFIHPKPIDNCFTLLKSKAAEQESIAGSVKQDAENFKSYGDYLFKTAPSQNKTYLSTMFNLIFASYTELENYAKDFYSNHKNLHLKHALQIQPTYEDFIEESLSEYKEYQLQCEMSWIELVHQYLQDISDFHMYLKDYCEKSSLYFKEHILKIYEKHYNEQLAKLNKEREETRGAYLKVHSKLKPLHGHHNNKHLLVQLEEEILEVERSTKTPDFESTDLIKKLFGSHLLSLAHKNRICEQVGDGVQLIKHAFKTRMTTFRIPTPSPEIDMGELLVYCRSKVLGILRRKLGDLGNIKFSLELFGQYTQPTKEREETKSFNTKAIPVTEADDLEELVGKLEDIVKTKASEFDHHESGWVLKNWLWLELNISKFSPLAGSSYMELPKVIQNRKACVNIQNQDQKCFMWSVLAALHPVDRNTERLSNYTPYEGELNFDGIEFPVSVNQIAMFEKLNNISVNVYGLEKMRE